MKHLKIGLLAVFSLLCTVLTAQKFTKNIEFIYSIGDGSNRYQKSIVQNRQQSVGLKASFGKTIREKLFIGGGLGYEYYQWHQGVFEREYKRFLHVTADARYKILKTKVSPIVGFSGGYTFKLGDMGGRWVANPAIGVIYPWTSKLSHYITVGYKFHRCRSYSWPWGIVQYYETQYKGDITPVEYHTHNFVTLSTGFTF